MAAVVEDELRREMGGTSCLQLREASWLVAMMKGVA